MLITKSSAPDTTRAEFDRSYKLSLNRTRLILTDTVVIGGYEIQPEGEWAFEASIPEVLEGLLGYHSTSYELARGACLHDALYRSKTGIRRVADTLACDIWQEDSTRSRSVRLMHMAVRSFGSMTWEDAEDIAHAEMQEKIEKEFDEELGA